MNVVSRSGWQSAPDGRGPASGVALAPHGARLVAFIVDSFILGIVTTVVMLVAVVLGVTAALTTNGAALVGLLALLFVVLLISLGYFPWFWAHGGQTPGMRLFGLRVVRAVDGGSVGGGQGIVRLIGYWVSALVFYIGFAWVLVDGQRRGWHDLIAGTVVITDGAGPAMTSERARRLFAATEIDLRLFGMLAALVLILFVFNVLSGGKLVQPANMITMAVQAAGIAIIATGMVFVIVSRNIDLSVGSLVGLIAMSYAILMTDWFPNILGIGANVPFQWALALALGIGLGAAIGALQGFIIAYVGVPSFIVTLGGLLSIRGLVWYQSQGAAVTGLDPTFDLIGGGALGSIGANLTWLLGLIGGVAIVGLLINGRRQRRRYGFPLRPMWAEVLIGGVGCATMLGLAWFANNNFWPKGLAEQYAQDHNIPIPPGGLQIPSGFPLPIVLLIGVMLVMTWLATRRRFGRYVYAYGGNPDAAELAGINTRWTILKIYALMGVLCALAAAIATARLNGATLDIGVSYELYVIAAAVVGGTSFAGGIGTIPGAVIGAFVMQSLSYGLSFLGVNSPGQNVVAGIVLILAVGFDTLNRRRGK